MSSESPRLANTLKILLLPFLAAHLVFPVLWLVLLIQDGPRMNDWRHFQVAAEQFVSGNWTDLYTDRFDTVHPGYFWRYPPYALYVVAPLAWLSPLSAYLVVAGIGVAALVASVALLMRLAPPPDMRAEWATAIVLSAPALTTLITGQISSLLLLCVVSAALLWTKGRVVAACAVLGLLAFKPNLGIYFGCYVLARGEWRGLAAMIAVVLALCVASLPLGFGLWGDFLRLSLANADVISLYEPHKMITLRSFLAAILGGGRAAFVAWALVSLGLVALSIRAWRRRGSLVEDLGLVALLAIATNPYAFFYDALLLVIPGAVWWSQARTWNRNRWLTVGVLIALGWCWEQWAHVWRELLTLAGLGMAPPFSLVGPVAGLWLVLAALEKERDHSSRHPQDFQDVERRQHQESDHS